MVVLAALGIPAVHSLLFALIFMLSRFMPRRRMLMPFFAASLWVVFEWALSLGQLAFPWGRLAVSQYLFLPMIQTASLFGAYFIAFVMVVSCAFFALFAVAPRRSALAAGCIVLAGNILGKTRTVSVAIASETAAGNYDMAGFWVIVIILISFLVVAAINIVSGRGMQTRRWI